MITQVRTWPLIAAEITDHGGHGSTVLLTARDESGTEMGWLQYERHAFGVSLFYVMVEPGYRRRGVASILMDRLYEDNPDAVICRGFVFPDAQRFHTRDNRTRGISDDLAVLIPDDDPVMPATARLLMSRRGASGRLV